MLRTSASRIGQQFAAAAATVAPAAGREGTYVRIVASNFLPASRACARQWWGGYGPRHDHGQGGAGGALLQFARGRACASTPSHPPPSSSLPSSSAASSIGGAGENTKEFFVKVPEAELTSGMHADQSDMRDRLITLLSILVALYVGFFTLPLIGGWRSTSLCTLHNQWKETCQPLDDGLCFSVPFSWSPTPPTHTRRAAPRRSL